MTAKVLYFPSCFFVGAKFMEDRYIGDVTGHDWIHVRIESEPSRAEIENAWGLGSECSGPGLL